MNILLVDQDAFARNVFARALTKEGYNVLQADSASTVAEVLRTETIDFITVDGALETAGESSLMAEIRANRHFQPAILLRSVFREEEASIEHKHYSAVLDKPISPSELLTQIARIRESRRPSPTDTLELLRSQVDDFAANIDRAIFSLEASIRQQRETNSDANQTLFEATQLVERCRQFGFVRVSQALGRVEQALSKIDARTGRMNRQLWAELNDALDDAYVAAKRHVMEHRRQAPDRETTVRRNISVVVLDEDGDIGPQLERYGSKHLFEVTLVHTLDELVSCLKVSPLHAVVVDVDDFDPNGPTIQALATLNRKRTPLAVISDSSDMNRRLAAASIGATRFMEKPLDGTEFADAVQYMAALTEKPNLNVVLFNESGSSTLEDVFGSFGYETLLVSDVQRISECLREHSASALVVECRASDSSTINLIRAVRAIPRWSELPIICHCGGGAAADILHAGADDVVTPDTEPDELHARILNRLRRTRLLTDRADRDLLTGLLTRRALLERVSIRMSEARRSGKPVAIALLDLDRFKRINDTFGHLAGDRVLMELGRMLNARFRAGDVRGRWGGEEFAVMLVDQGADVAKAALQRVLDEFSAHEFRTATGEVFNVTFSAGIAEFPEDGVQFEELLKKADERLFESKVAGRNRITK